MGVEAARWVEDFLPKLAEPGLKQVDVESIEEGQCHQGVVKELHRERRKQRHAQRHQAEPLRWKFGHGPTDEAQLVKGGPLAEEGSSGKHGPREIRRVESGEKLGSSAARSVCVSGHSSTPRFSP